MSALVSVSFFFYFNTLFIHLKEGKFDDLPDCVKRKKNVINQPQLKKNQNNPDKCKSGYSDRITRKESFPQIMEMNHRSSPTNVHLHKDLMKFVSRVFL